MSDEQEQVAEVTATVPGEFKDAANVIARTVANALAELPGQCRFAGLAVIIAFHREGHPARIFDAVGAYTSNSEDPPAAVAHVITKYAQHREQHAPGPKVREVARGGTMRGLLMHRPHRRRR